MAIKKAYTEVIKFLEDNENSKVKTILDAVKAMCSAKAGGAGGGSTYIKNEAGVITHVFCYYHKRWEAVNVDGKGDETHAEYGSKANSATGLNSMCKEGTSNWTKQQSAAKKAGGELLKRVASGEVAPSDIPAEQEKIEKARSVVVDRADGLGTVEAPK